MTTGAFESQRAAAGRQAGSSIWVTIRRHRLLLLYLAWIQALIATAGSLYFSEVRDLPPCVLCWYQRILMYPLTVIIAVGILRLDRSLPLYVLPLSLAGIAVASYHNLLYYGVIPEDVVHTCALGISCTTRQIEWLGFITIPLMSLTAFAVITALMATYLALSRNWLRRFGI